MNTTSSPETAQIYQFPARGRFAVAREGFRSAENVTSLRVANVAFGSGWYHEEAIQDAERTR